MTTVHITLPDALAEEAAGAGLLEPAVLETILRERLRDEQIARMQSRECSPHVQNSAPNRSYP